MNCAGALPFRPAASSVMRISWFVAHAGRARPAWATNHEILITELAAGLNGNAPAQFIEIKQCVAGQTRWAPQPGEATARARLEFYDGAGALVATVPFVQNPPD